MLWLKSLILNFFLLILRILFNFNPDVYQKYNWFSKTLLKKDIKFVLYKRNNTIIFNLSFVLLQVEINLIAEKQNCKKDVFRPYSIDYVEIILTLLAKIISLYI